MPIHAEHEQHYGVRIEEYDENDERVKVVM